MIPTRKKYPTALFDKALFFPEKMLDDFFVNRHEDELMTVDIKETTEGIKVEAEMPGATKEEIQLDFHGGALTIKRTQEEKREEKEGEKYLLRERVTRQAQRTFRFDKDLAQDQIGAELNNGVLTIFLPYAKAEKKTAINIK